MSIGEALASAREERGLTVEDVSQATRIRATLVRAIERDDFALCGGAVYARGHIRSIARYVGADPVPLIEEFDREHGAVPSPMAAAELFEAEARTTRSERSGPRWGFAMVAAVLVGVCAVALYSILGSRGSPGSGRTAVVAQKPTSAAPHSMRTSVAPTTTPATSVRPTAPPSDLALNRNDGVSVRLRLVGDRSWVAVTSGTGAKLFEGTLTSGSVRDFKDAKELRLIVGAPAAVDLVVNGKDIGLAGPAGPVAHLVFHPGDPGTGSRG